MIKYCRISLTTDSSGAGSTSLQIPGTFGGIDRTQNSYSGRLVKNASLWFSAPIPGDCVTSLTVTDTAGILPAPIRSSIASYPILSSWGDAGVSSTSQGLFLYPNNPTSICPQEGKNNIPSQLYLNIMVQKGAAVIDTFFINIEWDDGT